MSTSRVLFTALTLTACGALAASASPITLNLRPGLWQMTSQGQMTGAPPVPAELLAQLPPERRAKLQAAMAASQARASAPRVFKQCITRKSLQRGIEVDDKHDANHCRPTVVSSTATVMEMSVQCKDPRVTVSGLFHFETANPETVSGTVNMTMSMGGAKSMHVKRTIEGKWMGADCGDVKAAGE
jgi:Protein of unknown function (DUF3617)